MTIVELVASSVICRTCYVRVGIDVVIVVVIVVAANIVCKSKNSLVLHRIRKYGNS